MRGRLIYLARHDTHYRDERTPASFTSKSPGAVDNGDTTWSIPCDSKWTLPPLVLTINGAGGLAIPAEEYVLMPTTTGSANCLSAYSLVSHSGKPNTWILGDVFLKNFYTVSETFQHVILLQRLMQLDQGIRFGRPPYRFCHCQQPTDVINGGVRRSSGLIEKDHKATATSL